MTSSQDASGSGAMRHGQTLHIGYLINQYPKISHTFVRTEIAGLEQHGALVARYSIRPSPDTLIDTADLEEAAKTKVILNARWQLLLSLLRSSLGPVRLIKAVALAFRVGRRSESGVFRHLIYTAEACLLKDWTRNAGVQHIHAHFGTNSTAVAMLCRVLGGPTYSFTVHGPEEFDKPGVLSLSTKIEYADFVIAVSNFGKAQLWRQTAATDWGKVHVVRCGVDERFVSQLSRPIGKEPVFVCVGRLSEQKGQLVLLTAASALKARGARFELLIIGDGELRSLMESSISDLDLGDCVSIVGWQTPGEVRQHLESCRTMVLPSFAEGLPIVIMESMALRRPVISTYIAGIPELIEPGRNGWLVPAGAVEQLVDAMQESLDCSTEQLDAMGRAGQQKVLEMHDARRNAGQLYELVQATVRKK